MLSSAIERERGDVNSYYKRELVSWVFGGGVYHYRYGEKELLRTFDELTAVNLARSNLEGHDMVL